MGTALAGGFATWKADEDVFVGNGYPAQLDGTALAIPLDVSVLWRSMLSHSPFELTLEGGMRYVVVDSCVNLATTDFSCYHEGELDADNGLIGVFGAGLGFPVSYRMNLAVGVGYQFDMAKGDVEWLRVDIAEFEMKGFYFNAGVNIGMYIFPHSATPWSREEGTLFQ